MEYLRENKVVVKGAGTNGIFGKRQRKVQYDCILIISYVVFQAKIPDEIWKQR